MNGVGEEGLVLNFSPSTFWHTTPCSFRMWYARKYSERKLEEKDSEVQKPQH